MPTSCLNCKEPQKPTPANAAPITRSQQMSLLHRGWKNTVFPFSALPSRRHWGKTSAELLLHGKQTPFVHAGCVSKYPVGEKKKKKANACISRSKTKGGWPYTRLLASGPSVWLDSLGAREGWVKFSKHPRVVSVTSA